MGIASSSHHGSGAKSGSVKYLETLAEFNDQLAQCKEEGKLLVVDYTASWCGPCQYISPIYEQMSNEVKYKEVVFMKIDVDQNKQTSRAQGVRCMPTFKVYRDGVEVNELQGASEEQLRGMVSSELKHVVAAPALVTASA